jgi:sec-independent protein translocase protein TatC
MESPEAPLSKMSFWEHLSELRTRIIRSLFIIIGAFSFTYGFPFGLQDMWETPVLGLHPFRIFKGMQPFRFELWSISKRPFLEAMARQTRIPMAELHPFAFTDLTEPFISMMRLALWAAAFLAAPFLFYQLWAFIRPGLLPKERRLVVPFVLVTSSCFLGGVAFAYFKAVGFLGDILFQEAAAAGLRANLHASDYLDLFIYTTLITGIMFELPVLFYFLARFRLVTARWMLKYWRHATLIIVIFSAFFTPGDVILTAIFFSVLLLGLYFVSVVVAWVAEPRQPRA